MKKTLAVYLAVFMLTLVATAPVMALLVFSDDFSGDLSNWTIINGTWVVESEECYQSDDAGMRISITGANWNNCIVQTRLKRTSAQISNAWVGVLFRVLDGKNFYLFGVRRNAYYLGKYVDGVWVKIQPWTAITVDNRVWNTLKVGLTGNAIDLWLNDVFIGSFTDSWRLSGKIGLASGYCKSRFDDVTVVNPHPINAVPEPTPIIVSIIFVATLASYWLVRKRTGNKTIVKPTMTQL